MFDIFYTLLFFALFKWGSLDLALKTMMTLSAIVVLWQIYHKDYKNIHTFSHVMVAFFSMMSLLFQDPIFYQLKPTLIYLVLAFVLWFYIPWRGKSLLEDMIPTERQFPLSSEKALLFHQSLSVFYLILAMANALVCYSCTFQIWVYMKVVFLLIHMAFILGLIAFVLKPDSSQ